MTRYTFTQSDIRKAQEVLEGIMKAENANPDNLSGVSVDSVVTDLIRIMNGEISLEDGKVVFA